MSSGAAADWIRDRAAGAPANLLDRMVSALPGASQLPIAEQLVEAAVLLYAAVVRGSGGREDALTLLAADALFTHAFDAQAALDPAHLGGFATTWANANRLTAILPPTE